jgi:hypothetical protein
VLAYAKQLELPKKVRVYKSVGLKRQLKMQTKVLLLKPQCEKLDG